MLGRILVAGYAMFATLALAQSVTLVPNTTPAPNGVDGSPNFRDTRYTFDLKGVTGGSDWTGTQINVEVVGVGRIWHATDERRHFEQHPLDPNLLCYIHNLNSPNLANNATNQPNSRLYDTFCTGPGPAFRVDPLVAYVFSPGPFGCPPEPPVLSTDTRLDCAWFDLVNAALNNTTLMRITFEVPSGELIVASSPADCGTLFASLTGRITSAANPSGAVFQFNICTPAAPQPDCNGNGVEDGADIASGVSGDCDSDGIPDECACPEDITRDARVDLTDLATLLVHFGESGSACVDGDVNRDGAVDLTDLALLLRNFGLTCN